MNEDVKRAVEKTQALVETAILALDKINETEANNVAEVLRETREYTDKLYAELDALPPSNLAFVPFNTITYPDDKEQHPGASGK